MEPILVLIILILFTSPYATLLVSSLTLFYLIFLHNPAAVHHDDDDEMPSLVTESEDNGWGEPDDNGWETPVETPWDGPVLDYQNDVEWAHMYGWTRADIRNATWIYDIWEDGDVGQDSSEYWDPTDGTSMERISTFREMALAYAAPAPPALFHWDHPLAHLQTPSWLIPTSSDPIPPPEHI